MGPKYLESKLLTCVADIKKTLSGGTLDTVVIAGYITLPLLSTESNGTVIGARAPFRSIRNIFEVGAKESPAKPTIGLHIRIPRGA